MKDEVLVQVISDELSQAEQALDFQTPLDYYIGNPRGDECEGRSQVISTDVADSIEWIMPQVMKSFTQNNEIVIFDPLGPGDELQAELESQYVYEILMKENDGFINLHQMVKDALMQNNGFLKVWYEEHTNDKTISYTGISEEQLGYIAADPSIEILNLKESVAPGPNGQPQTVYKLKIRQNSKHGRIRIESVAPEDFRVNPDHNSINMDEARFTAHLMEKTVSDLREEGVSEDIIQKLKEENYGDSDNYRLYAQGETSQESDTDDDSQDIVSIAECYLFADIDDDGISERVKVTVGGHSTPTVLIDKEEVDCFPWIATTPILMSHKWRGMSIYDRLKQIQDIKTSLLRNLLDNIYLQNNQRNAVLENQVTMSDLMLSRPGGVVRVKNIDAIKPLPTPLIGDAAFNMLNYMDTIRAGRSGVSPEGELQQKDIGERVGSQGLQRLMNAKEELVGLIIRIFAETAIKPLCYKIRDLCTKHMDAVRDFRFRGQWVKVAPSQWSDRIRSTVRVGTGTGNHQMMLMSLEKVIQFQAAKLQEPGQTLVNPVTQFKAIDDFCKFSGLNSAVGYFVDPSSPQGQQFAQQVKQQQQMQQQQNLQQQAALMQLQVKLADAEMGKARAQMDNVTLKGQVDKSKMMLESMKERHQQQLDMIKQDLERAKAMSKDSLDAERLDLERDKHAVETGLKISELALKKQELIENARTAREIGEQNGPTAGA